MTAHPIESLLVVPRLTAGRRHLALTRMLQIVNEDPSLAALAVPIADALEAQSDVIADERRWRAAQDDLAMHADAARTLDQKLDRALSALHAGLTHAIRAYDEDSPEAKAARVLLELAFPAGVGAITSLPFVDQHATVTEMTTQIHALPALSAAVATLHLEGLLDRIAMLNKAYGDVLTQPERLTWDALKDADRHAWIATHTVIAHLVGMFPNATTEEDAVRARLLQPLMDQQAELAKLRSRRAMARNGDADADADADAEPEDEDLASALDLSDEEVEADGQENLELEGEEDATAEDPPDELSA